MENLYLKLKFTGAKNCFAGLPRAVGGSFDSLKNPSEVLVTIITEGLQLTLTWNGSFSADSDSLEISGVLGQHLGLQDSQDVLVSIVRLEVPIVRQLELQPASPNDWELVSENAGEVEELLLNQVAIVSAGFTFPVWVHRGAIKLFLRVTQLGDGLELGRLSQKTELLIKPCTSPSSDSGSELHDNNAKGGKGSSVVTSLFTKFSSIFQGSQSSPEKSEDSVKEEAGTYHVLYSLNGFSKSTLLRVLPTEMDDDSVPLSSTVIVNAHEFNLQEHQEAIAHLTKIQLPNSMLSEQPEKTATKAETSISVKPPFEFTSADFSSTYVLVRATRRCPPHCVQVCDTLRRQMNLGVNCRVVLERTQHEKTKQFNRLTATSNLFVEKHRVSAPRTVSLTPLGSGKYEKEAIKTFLSNYCQKHKYLILANGTLLRISSVDFLVTVQKGDLCHAITDSDVEAIELEVTSPMFQKIQCSSGGAVPVASVKEVDTFSKFHHYSTSRCPVVGFDDILAKMKSFFNVSLRLEPLGTHLNTSACPTNAILLCGPKGSGKTTAVQYICQDFSQQFVCTRVINCKSLRGKRLDSLQKSWSKELTNCLVHQPCILVFEDLDVIASASRLEESEVEAMYAYRVSLIFISLIKTVEKIQKIWGIQFALVATVSSLNTLHPLLTQSRGRHVFLEVIELKLPNADARKAILHSIIENRCNIPTEPEQNLNLHDVSRRCENYLPADLGVLVDKAIHNCAVRCAANGQALCLAYHDFEKAIEQYEPVSLRGLTCTLKSNRRLSDVGGMDGVKRTLLETLLWPSKYPKLFAKCPIRPSSCILLFGAPGTGKTLLAEAIASECGVSFISIKGPELLSKYIGASELAVRNLFGRANSAKPCILFFDEFDAIAPRRGHDSTGVTDRVVNQLLTQMDGVEALGEGVYVLAATSRPDLLDPALLRPGRFDKCLYCPFPGAEEREKILTALSSKLTFNGDVDLKAIAEKTNDYTGADLQALLYTAQLEALHEKLADEAEPQSAGKIENNSRDKNDGGRDIYYLESIKKGFNRDLPPNLVADLEKQLDVITRNHEKTLGDDEVQDIGGASQNTGLELIRIGTNHLEIALGTTKASVGSEERQRYFQLSQMFGGFEKRASVAPITGLSKKATLA